MAGKADRHALCEKRRERQRFCLRPIDSAVPVGSNAATLKLALKFAVGIKAFRNGQQLLVEQAQRFV